MLCVSCQTYGMRTNVAVEALSYVVRSIPPCVDRGLRETRNLHHTQSQYGSNTDFRLPGQFHIPDKGDGE